MQGTLTTSNLCSLGSQFDKFIKGKVSNIFFDLTFLDGKVVGDFVVDELTVVRCVEDIHKVCMFQFPFI